MGRGVAVQTEMNRKLSLFTVLRDHVQLVEIQDDGCRCYIGSRYRGFWEATRETLDSGWGVGQG